MSTVWKPCLVCGQLSRQSRCSEHRLPSRGAWAWTKHSRRLRAEHLRRMGPMCPGFGRPPHVVHPSQLSADHLQPLAAGGELITSGVTVLCVSCNARRGADR